MKDRNDDDADDLRQEYVLEDFPAGLQRGKYAATKICGHPPNAGTPPTPLIALFPNSVHADTPPPL